MERDKWDRMLDEYYELHGWDKKTSWPFKKTLQKLKLGDVVDVLEKRVSIQLDANLPV